MKANEIMTGDYFRITKTGKIIKVIAVDECTNTVDYFDGDAGGALTIGLDKIEPISLTKEILEKIGFERRKLDGGAEEFIIAEDYYDIAVQEWSDSIWLYLYNCTEMHIPHEQRTFGYVHNLQHAFNDCNVEKEMVL